jgi:phospholipase C
VASERNENQVNAGRLFAEQLVSVTLIITLASCVSQARSFNTPPSQRSDQTVGQAVEQAYMQQPDLKTPIRHVIIIFQENRTPDYLFQHLPGADIAKTAIDSHGRRIALHAVSLAAGYDLPHDHSSFVEGYDRGKMDGFDKGLPTQRHRQPYGYAPASEVKPYHEMATQYVFADHMFQTNEGPSFPAHLYIISGTASDPEHAPYKVMDNPYAGEPLGNPMAQFGIAPVTGKGGCNSQRTMRVTMINPADGSIGPAAYPCFDRTVLSDLLDAKDISWRYYQQGLGAGLWHAFDAIAHVRHGSDYANVVTPPQTILTDISSGRLAGVSWVTPANPWSDHANPIATTKGPSWVAAIVNAVGQSKYWKSTAIFITWDDWGGWYDHVPPPIDNHYELGFRVPLVIVSPYAKHHYVSKVQHEFGSILAFTEETFGIAKGSLNSTDRRSDDLRDAFDFTQGPRVFKHIEAPPFVPGVNIDLDAEDP